MPKFYNEVRKIPGRNKLNIFGLFIAKIKNLKALTTKDRQLTHALIKEVKRLFENHEQSLTTLSFIIKQYLLKNKASLSPHLIFFLKDVIDSIDNSDMKTYYQITFDDMREADLSCEFARRFESEVAVQLLMNPSKVMLDTIKGISTKIIKILQGRIPEHIFTEFLSGLGPEEPGTDLPYYAFSFGRFSKTPSLARVIDTLQSGRDFHRIMLIHFLFMRNLFPDLDLHESFASKMNDLKFTGDLGNFVEQRKGKDTYEILEFFSNYPRYAPHLYTDRGRVEFKEEATHHMGIMLDSQDRRGLLKTKTAWYPDCLCNIADLKSDYVQTLICMHDIPYVSGPSGMTSILLGVLTFFGDMQNQTEINYYILAIMSFIVGGGLHSIHEVLTVPAIRLGILPGYITSGRGAGNYDRFFQLFENDRGIAYNLKHAWDNFISYIETHFPELCKRTVTDSDPSKSSDAIAQEENLLIV